MCIRDSPYPVLGADELVRCGYLYPRLNSISGTAVVPFADLAEAQTEIRFYTFLREPIERCVTEFVSECNLRRPNDPLQSFEAWIQRPEVRNRQCRQICGTSLAERAIPGLHRIEFVGLIERFHESLVLFSRWTNNPRTDIRYHLRKQTRETTLKRKLLTNLSCRRQLIEANREDVRLYDHVCREVFPLQCDEYGDRLEADVQAFEAFNMPPGRFPREAVALAYRELVYRPLSGMIAAKFNPTIAPPAYAPRRAA